ncbi:MAG TPA: hypothetical protein VH044_14695 [Polyangiaceae bacterium]|nr:hypothetical protein [Polyangiaceae bacterium]
MVKRPATALSVLVAGSVVLGGCGATERRFALRDPLTVDTDLRSVSLPCRKAPNEKEKDHVSCAPAPYVSPLIWDGADNMVFRPLAELWAFKASDEATNANSLDEVADSAWFTNRLGVQPLTDAELLNGACTSSQLMLDTTNIPDGTWVIDKGKQNGSSPGFRIKIPGKGKYLLKVDDPTPERPSAAAVIGALAYHAVGFNFSCEQVVYVKRSVFKLTPGLTMIDNSERVRPFDEKALDEMLKKAPRKGDYLRFQASAWLEGSLIGPFRYEKTRADDPNDVIPHDQRRELRGGRILAAWLDHFDAREQNSMDAWMADRKDQPDSSPGHVVHYYLDTSDCLGSEWNWEVISRRLGHSYIADWGDIATDFFTLGIPTRPWDTANRVPGKEIFGFFDADHFSADQWKNEYPNPAFSRMTERDGAWMARILARMTPELVKTLASAGQFSDPANTEYLARMLQGRLDKILDRYLTRLSPVADVHLEGGGLCATDLAALRAVRDPALFQFRATTRDGLPLAVAMRDASSFCVNVPHRAPDGITADNDPYRYVGVRIDDGVSRGPLVAYLYDLGATRGFRLVGVERPE